MSKSRDQLAIDELQAVFGPQTENAFISTGSVLVKPSSLSTDLASASIEAMNLAPVLTNIGVLCAQAIATELEGLALRPADYAGLPELPESVAKRVAKELAKAPTQFVAALIETLKARG